MHIRLNHLAALVQIDQHLFVKLAHHHYAREELVPISILDHKYKTRDTPRVFTAGQFATACLLSEYGDVGSWPAEAVEFVFSETT